MNKWEFLQILRESLTQMPEEEVNAAIRYYEEYFDEAGEENEARVLQELGSPEQVAKQILAEGGIKDNIKEYRKNNNKGGNQNTVWIAIILVLSMCVIGAAFKKYSSNKIGINKTQNGAQTQVNHSDTKTINGKYIDVNTALEAFDRIDVEVDMMDVEIRTGKEYKIELHYNSACKMDYAVNNKVLKCIQKNNEQLKNSKNKMTIYVPEGTTVNDIVINSGMGRNRLTNIAATDVTVSSGMGDMDAIDVKLGEIKAELGMGNIDIEGSIAGNIDLDDGMGNMKLDLTGKRTDYNYDLDSGLGKIEVDGVKAGNIEEYKEDNNAESEIKADNGMGNIKITFK